VQADWKGFGKPVFLLQSRRGQLQALDVFSNPTGGYSGAIVAATGSGKSVFANEFIMSYLGIGGRAWIIDRGDSYLKTCRLVGGDYVSFDKATRVCINPFTNVLDLPEEMPMLKSIVAQMASRRPLESIELAYIEEAIKESFSTKGTKMTVTTVAEVLKDGGDPRQRDIAQMLFPYTKEGAYATFFEGEGVMKTSSRFSVVELGGIQTKKDLLDVVVLSVAYQQMQELVKERGEIKISLIDEGYALLTGSATGEFVPSWYRQARKYRGAAYVSTQGINDFDDMPGGTGMLENSDFLFLLRQRPESIEALRKNKKLLLSDYEFDLLQSVHTDTGNYSEVFIYAPMGRTIGRLTLSRFSQLLYTSKAEEFVKIEEYMKKGLSVTEAIEKVIEEENISGKRNKRR
jgi:conjugal transfer ATP-binding protein TraC